MPHRTLILATPLLLWGGCAGSGQTSLDRHRVSHRVDAVTVAPGDADSHEPPDGDDVSAAEIDVDSVVPPDTDAADTDAGQQDAGPGCPVGHACNPIVIGALPFSDSRDTGASTSRTIDVYSGCAPDTDESGPELFYRVDVEAIGVLTVAVDDVSGDGVDVDVHLLEATEGASCVRRDNKALSWVVRPGSWWISVDTWVDGGGDEKAGAYTLTVALTPLASGPCAVTPTDLRMFWSACAGGVDCFVGEHADEPARFLRTPSLGPVVHEAHLVTTGEDFDGNGWPTSASDGLERHYQLSEAASGYAMERSTVWAPFGEGGSQWGQGATGAKVPAEAEAWYVNMYWRARPAPGTRMLVFNPANGRAVVAAGGYETGPGSNTAIGGAVEEIHHHLGTSHRDDLVMGFLSDQTLPYGPVTCEIDR